jgi:hypothetical protein
MSARLAGCWMALCLLAAVAAICAAQPRPAPRVAWHQALAHPQFHGNGKPCTACH